MAAMKRSFPLPLAVYCLSSLLCFAHSAVADDLSVLPPRADPEMPQPPSAPHDLTEALQHAAFAALALRREAYESVESEAQAIAWQTERREFFLRQLGDFPERSPLRAETTGELRGDGYRIEKVVFESRPGHRVTGNLYLPDGGAASGNSAPWPAVLIPCGHSFNGKAAEQYQRASILFALNGIAAFCYDPIGQGERYQAFAPDGTPLSADYELNPNSLARLEGIPGSPRFNPVEEHTLVGTGAILVGRNTASYRIWDGMRAIDYLQSRPDIDPDRIGCTGNSGGGTLTAYLMALDERVAAAGPGCYLTTFERLIATRGPQDAEQNLHGQIAFGLDQADYVLLAAPRPVTILAGTRDSTFDIVGTWDIFRESKRFYARFGLPERVDLVEADAPHGFTPQLREGSVRWMRRWLLDSHDPVEEPDFPVWTDAELQVTAEGQVMLGAGERSAFDFNRERAAELAEVRAAYHREASPEDFRALVAETLSLPAAEELPPLVAEHRGTLAREGHRIEKILLRGEDGRLPLPLLVLVPETPAAGAVLFLAGTGKEEALAHGERAETLVQAGHLVVLPDLSGLGETSGLESRPRYWASALFGPDGEPFWLAYLLGKSLVGLRTADILQISAFLLDEELELWPQPDTLALEAVGVAGTPALHAAALAPERFSGVLLRDSLRSWTEVVEAPLGHAHLTETVHGVLERYDLPDLERLVGTGRVRWQEPLAPK